jgi:DNA-binding NtrC family response regulator
MTKILLVEDQVHMREILKAQLEQHQFMVDEAPNLEIAAQKIEHGKYDVFVLDLKLPDGNSIRMFDMFPAKLASRSIVITANATVPSVVEAIKKGAFNYLEKPVDEDLLIAQVKKIVELNQLKDNYRTVKSEVASDYVFDDIIYESRQMDEIIERAKVLAKTDNTVLIQGETGVGKEVISQSIHNHSLRKSETFLPVNCASIPTELVESELFGFEKGAFTGAVNSYGGRFIQADNGTLFLDEIGELPLHIQAKLLRILDEKVIYQLKSKKALKINIRMVAATNKNLGDEVNLKQFRGDLYYRLKESSITIPPLRERVEDIIPLIRHFIEVYNHIYDKNVTKISKEAERYFLNYSWKGNVRELKNTVKSIIPFKKNNTIDLEDLSYSIIEGKEAPDNRFPSLEDYEKKYVLKVLRATGFNITRASEVLGINRPRLYRKIKQYELEEAIKED